MLTEKQEAYCHYFIELNNQSAAYRKAYDAEMMAAPTVWKEACILHADPNVSVRISELRKELYDRNKASLDEIIYSLSEMLRFDPADMYDGHGALKSIHDMPIPVRKMISELSVYEEKIPDGQGGTVVVGETRKVKTLNKMDAIEKLLKHLGGYEKDNFQKKVEVKATIVQWGDKQISI